MTQLGRRSSVKETKKKKRLRLPQGRGDAENEGGRLFLSFFVVVAVVVFLGWGCVCMVGGRRRYQVVTPTPTRSYLLLQYGASTSPRSMPLATAH